MFTLNCGGRLLASERPLVMGIINLTGDSFYAGSRIQTVDEAVAQAGRMLSAGAAILDIGGQSTRPGSRRIPAEEEAQRVIPVLAAIRNQYPEAFISVDTFYAVVAAAAAEAGAAIINDISAGRMDPDLLSTVAKTGLPYVLMHMQGRPDHMQDHPVYADVTGEVHDFLVQGRQHCLELGIRDVILDPGFGFGKTIDHNFELLRNLSVFRIAGAPLLVGLSRKSTVYKTLGTTADQALNGTTVMHTIGLLNGAQLLRVHDVKEAVEAISLVEKYRPGWQ